MLDFILKPFRVLYYLIIRIIKIINAKIKYRNYRTHGRPITYSETYKAKKRRIKESFFEKYCNGNGLDIGYGGDLITPNAKGIDIEHGDATHVKSLSNLKFDFIYSSHLLEHLQNPKLALQNWWKILKNNGCLILYIPHRDLYEKKKTLPSKFNTDHKQFFLLDKNEAPDTLGIIPLINNSLENFKIIYAKICNENYKSNGINSQSEGEYSIEIVIKKK